ncbi:hypothetical protein QYE76_031895 [Lolium multiflorum]|uniref:Uncharacterized protein n=1 Tax=Lolium multiflorum TaxID=4521 RepID=A0AAD8VHU7_LOLMU|nr:hypothetical protein QYE76_031895 [Lolium multiflorum]
MAAPQAACTLEWSRQTFRLLGRIVELSARARSWGTYAHNAGHLRNPWLGERPLRAIRAPKNTARLKRAVKEFDSGMPPELSTADARKALFEELLWEHRDLAEAHSKCQAFPEASLEALKDQIATLQAEKEQLIRDHQKALDAQKEISKELKDQAI